MNLIWGSSFRRAYRRMLQRDPRLKRAIQQALRTFADDPFAASLRTYKLSGQLEGLWAFTVRHDCRVVFQFIDGDTLLVDIGTHDEVY